MKYFPNTLNIFAGAIVVLLGASNQLVADDPCHTKVFKTEMYKAACTAGDQKSAKDAAKKFMKDHHIQSCNQCHSKLAPNYELKVDGLEQFLKAGGKGIGQKPVLKPIDVKIMKTNSKIPVPK